ncbi:hypothetical protein [uncultured Nostoc sp.]|uniref:hypothetical protein n=1 Tax=uncultured Nostoc sp. TaxID=340711 RepID=UPI0035CBDBFD
MPTWVKYSNKSGEPQVSKRVYPDVLGNKQGCIGAARLLYEREQRVADRRFANSIAPPSFSWLELFRVRRSQPDFSLQRATPTPKL